MAKKKQAMSKQSQYAPKPKRKYTRRTPVVIDKPKRKYTRRNPDGKLPDFNVFNNGAPCARDTKHVKLSNPLGKGPIDVKVDISYPPGFIPSEHYEEVVVTVQPKELIHHDYSKENPDLHMLYVTTAVRHLCMIDRMLREINDCGNLNMLDIEVMLSKERAKLLRTNAAYRDAQEILREHQYGRTGKRPNDEPVKAPEEQQ